MSVEKAYGKVEFICDSCKKESVCTDDFYKTLEKAKQAGWFITKDKDGFKHYCEDCS